MPHESTNVDVGKASIVRSLFVNTADDNYLAARWCHANSLHVDFCWLAVHAIEKYLKGMLLLNGKTIWKQSGRRKEWYGHEIDQLYISVAEFVPELLPTELNSPAQWDQHRWRTETLFAYLQRLHRNGNANNRYQVYGYGVQFEDIFKLDESIFAIRRLCVDLDGYFLPRHVRRDHTIAAQYANESVRDYLLRNPRYWGEFAGNFADVASGERGEALRDIALKANYPFAPDDYDHGSITLHASGRTSSLFTNILRILQRDFDEKSKVEALALSGWVLENIRLPSDYSKKLRDLT